MSYRKVLKFLFFTELLYQLHLVFGLHLPLINVLSLQTLIRLLGALLQLGPIFGYVLKRPFQHESC